MAHGNHKPVIGDTELRLLHVFVIVARHQGLAAAQNELNLSLPTISAHMARLESRLGVRLCERGRSGFRLTTEGKRVYELSLSLLGSVDDFVSNVGALHNRLVGSLRIGIIDNIANNPACRIHEAIARFDAMDNDVEINVEMTAPNELERAVTDGRFNLGVGPASKHLPSLDYHPLFRERQHLYCAAHHELFTLDAPEEIEAAIARARYVAHLFPIPEFKAAGRTLQTATTSHTMEAVAVLLLSGRYIGFLPTHYAAYWEEKGEMRALLPERYYYESDFFAISRKHRQPSPLLSEFLRVLDEVHVQSKVAS